MGNVYPNHDPLEQLGVTDAEIPGGVYSFGDLAMTGAAGAAVGVPLLPRFGCTNPNGQVTITGTVTRAVIDFEHNESNNSYIVNVSCTGYTGTPAAGSTRPRVLSKTNAGFIVELEAAPGGGNSVTIAYTLNLAQQASTSTSIGETDFSSDTLRATANPGGIAGSAAGFWLVQVLRCDAVPSLTEWTSRRGFQHAVGGWAWESEGALGCQYRLADGAGSYRTPKKILDSSHVGKTHISHLVYTGTVARHYWNGVEVGSGTTCPFAPNAGRMMLGGNAAGSFMLTQHTLFGVGGGHAVPTPTQVAQHCSDIKAANRVVAMAGVATDGFWLTDGRATVTDDVGSDDITLVSGTTPVFVTVKPAWGF
jgi:hypothetical protein